MAGKKESGFNKVMIIFIPNNIAWGFGKVKKNAVRKSQGHTGNFQKMDMAGLWKHSPLTVFGGRW
jgi:hypothetical protein